MRDQLAAIGRLAISPTAKYVVQTMLVANIKSTREIHELTGLPERTIRRAKGEYYAAVSGGSAPPTPATNGRMSGGQTATNGRMTAQEAATSGRVAEEAATSGRMTAGQTATSGRPARAYKNPDLFGSIDSSSSGEGESRSGVDGAKPAQAGKSYAFEGETIRVTPADLEKWCQAYPDIPDLIGELRLADAYYSERPEKLRNGKWFFAVSRWLQRANTASKNERRSAVDRMIDEVCPPDIYRGLQ